MERLLNNVSFALPKDENIDFDPVEDGSSFLENAMIKAKALYEIVHEPVLADDSGLVLNCRRDILGIHTARFGCENGKISSRDQCRLLVDTMKDEKDRGAHFVCALVLYLGPDRFYAVEETAQGSIAPAATGTDGFGYDPVFILAAAGKTAAECTAEEKDLYSHRGKACRIMKKIIGECENA
jgi:Xanthosine triphosphate pyrophosphatase